MNELQTLTAIESRALAPVPGQHLSLHEITDRLKFIKNVMREVMVEGQDYGKIPGCGPKPALLQPGAQKLLLTFQLNSEVHQEKVTDLRSDHREYSFIVRISSPQGKFADGVGTCSTLESKYRYRQDQRECPACGQHAIAESKPEYGGGFYCNTKKGGCGAKFAADAEAILSQKVGRVDHDNPSDFWNTARKMAYKRALVAATINFTNTSDLWTQDEDQIAEQRNGTFAPPPTATDPLAPTPVYRGLKAAPVVATTVSRDAPPISNWAGGRWKDAIIHFGKNKGMKLGQLEAKSLNWYATEFKAEKREYPAGSGKWYEPSSADLALKAACDAAKAELWPDKAAAFNKAAADVAAQDAVPMDFPEPENEDTGVPF